MRVWWVPLLGLVGLWIVGMLATNPLGWFLHILIVLAGTIFLARILRGSNRAVTSQLTRIMDVRSTSKGKQ